MGRERPAEVPTVQRAAVPFLGGGSRSQGVLAYCGREIQLCILQRWFLEINGEGHLLLGLGLRQWPLLPGYLFGQVCCRWSLG